MKNSRVDWAISTLKEREGWDCNVSSCDACSHYTNGGYCAESKLVEIINYIEELENKEVICPLKNLESCQS